MVGIFVKDGVLHEVYPYAAGMDRETVLENLLRSVPEGIEPVIMETEDLPNYLWRDAWNLDGVRVVVDDQKAMAIAQKWIRSWRERWFAENDIDLQNAMADGAEITPFVNRRNWLRDLPQQCEGKTIEELNDLLTDLRIGRIWDLEDDYENS